MLENGLTVQQVALAALETTPQAGLGGAADASKPQGGEFYAPYSIGGLPTKLQSQAGRLKDALTKANALSSSMPSWASLFWQAVKNEKDIYTIETEIGTLLQSHGYIGDGTISPPRCEELKKALLEIETLGGPMHGSGGSFARIADVGTGDNPEQMAWHLKLPADLLRAAPELYRNLRSEGAASVRQWVNDQHPTLELKQTAAYQDLFTAATIVDYELAECRSESAIMHKLGTSDTLEIHLRKLGAFIYLRRTKDKAGANRMLGIRAPGSGSDIAPKWLLDDANAHSKLEWQRTERGQKMSRFESGSGSSGGGGNTKYAGKFRGRGAGGKGGGRGKQSPNKTQGWLGETLATDGLPVVDDPLHEQANLATADDVMLEAREFVRCLDQWALFPLPLPEQPTLKQHSSPRLRQRQARRMQVWRLAIQLVRTINALDKGAVGTWLTSPAAADEVRQVKATAARKLAVQHLIQRSAVLARARRGVSLTGVPTAAAVAMLLKQQLDDDGYLKYSGVRQVPMIADRMVEPAETRSIDMLEVLPLEDREFYRSEDNVVDPTGKCEVFFKELETQYGFVGGSEVEYLRYLAREDVKHLWEWDLMSNVRAVAGISTVPEKNGVDQRKLVMQVASNYMFSDPTVRSQLGMHGGAALSRCFIGSDKLSVAICDEDSAFTFVRVPKWMHTQFTFWWGSISTTLVRPCWTTPWR